MNELLKMIAFSLNQSIVKEWIRYFDSLNYSKTCTIVSFS